jgi:phage FluMu protein Com
MNLRCIYCQTPFTLARAEMLGAIVTMNEKGQNHYDAHCPRCRRANSISRQRMELFFPNWQDAAKQAAVTPVKPPPVPASASLKTEPRPKAMKAAATKKTEAKSAKAPAAKKSAPVKKAKVSKPAAKKTPAKTKKK